MDCLKCSFSFKTRGLYVYFCVLGFFSPIFSKYEFMNLTVYTFKIYCFKKQIHHLFKGNTLLST